MQGGVEFDSLELNLRALMGEAIPVPEPPLQMIGEVVGDTYEILRELGKGGMGQVFAARHARTGGEVAIKLIQSKHVAEDDFIERFEREAQNTAALNHPNIVKVFDYGLHEGLAFIAMELVQGQSVGRLLDEQHALKSDDAVAIAGHTLRALQVAHDAGLVHRDIKPDNILATRDGDSWFVKVLDFGIAHAFEAERVGPQSVIGSPHSMAPEQFHVDGAITPQADLYALGCTMFAMLTGYPPFHGTFWELAVFHAEETPPPLDGIDDPLADWVNWLLAKSPDDRPGSAQVALDALLEVERGRSVAPVVASHLPRIDTSFVGRETELAALDEHHVSGARLTTLTGVGGLGKTRLSLEWGRRNSRRFSGAYFCDLAETRTREGICIALARSVGGVLGDGDPVEMVGRVLAARGRALVILDNFEQIVAHADATVAKWLQTAPEVTFVVTSRHRLNLQGERIVRVSTLPTADPQSEGVQLFIDRATQARPDFELDERGRFAVRDIVEQLDGLPLAIEMAAARVRTMSPNKIFDRLGERFRLLRSSRRDISDRQMTMRATLDWSWALLDDAEQAALRQCAAFAGSFDLEAAEAIIDLSQHGGPWVVDTLESLIDKSLICRAEDDRLSMFVSVHDYALEKLSATDEEPAARTRHLAYFADYGTSAAISLAEKKPRGSHRRSRDIENLRAAARFAVAAAPSDDLARVVIAVVDHEIRNGLAQSTLDLGSQAITALREDSPDTARLHSSMASLYHHAGDDEVASAHAERGLAIARRLGDKALEASALVQVANMQSRSGRCAEAEGLVTAASELVDKHGNDRTKRLRSSILAGSSAWQGRPRDARQHLESALASARESGSRRDEEWFLRCLAWTCEQEGDPDGAFLNARLSLAIAEELAEPFAEAWSHFDLGSAFQYRGEYAAAVAHHDVSYKQAYECGLEVLANRALVHRARAAVAWGHPSAQQWAEHALNEMVDGNPVDRLNAKLVFADAILTESPDTALELVNSVKETDAPLQVNILALIATARLLSGNGPASRKAELAERLGAVDGSQFLLGKAGCLIEQARVLLELGELDAALAASAAASECLPFERMSAEWQVRDLCTRAELLLAHDRVRQAHELCLQVGQLRERLGLYPEAWLSQGVDQTLVRVGGAA